MYVGIGDKWEGVDLVVVRGVVRIEENEYRLIVLLEG